VLARQARLPGNMGGDQPVIAGDHFHGYAEVSQALDGFQGAWFDRIEQGKKPEEGHFGLIVPIHFLPAAQAPVREPYHPESLSAELLELMLDGFFSPCYGDCGSVSILHVCAYRQYI